MTFHCNYCHRQFAWENDSYPYIRSQIILHLDESHAASTTTEERTMEAARAADELFFSRQTISG